MYESSFSKRPEMIMQHLKFRFTMVMEEIRKPYMGLKATPTTWKMVMKRRQSWRKTIFLKRN